MSSPQKRVNIWIGWGLGLGAFIAYICTLSAGAYPGASAALVTQYTGLFVRMTPPRPLWGVLVWVLSKMPLGAVVTRLNVLSAVCGALSVVLIYRVVAGAVLSCIEITDRNRGRSRLAAQLGGGAAAVAMASCIPFWIVSTRTHTAAFDVLLLLVCARLILAYATGGRARTLIWFAVLYAAGVVEFATFIVMAPLFGGLLLFFMRRHEQLKIGPVFGLIGSAVAVMGALYLASAWCFYDSPGYHLRAFRSFWHIIWIVWRDQYLLIAHSLPRQGWLLVLVLTIIPWLTMLTVARRALNGEKDWAFYILHVVFTALALATLFNIKVAPWPMLGMRGLLVTPYVLTASLLGYVIAYWFLLPSMFLPFFRNEQPTARLKVTEALLTLPLLACVAATPFLNFRSADGRQAAHVNRFSREIVRSLDGRSWLITDGSLDDHLRIAADELDVPVNLISLMWNNKGALMTHVVSMFDDPGLKNRASIGLMPLLQEWCASDPEIDKKLALFASPDVLLSCGVTPLPHKLVFVAGGDPGADEADALMAVHRSFWEENADLLLGADPADAFLAPFCRHLRRRSALIANNLGVVMEDAGAKEDAAEAYRKAREIDPDNISALLNLHAMVRRGDLSDEDGAVREQLDALTETIGKSKVRIWSLSRDYGYVRTPGAFVDLGWYWAASGQPGMAVSGLKKAMELLPDEKHGPLKQALAGIYLMQDQPDESEALFYELLVENPQNQRALLGMARIEMGRGNSDKAESYLKRAGTAGVPEPLMDLEWATLDVVAGRSDEAIERLDALLSEKPKLLRGWALLTGIYIQQNDTDRLASAVRKMESLRLGGSAVIPIARGHLAVLSNDLDGAREAFMEASRLEPGNIKVLEWLLKLDMIQNFQTAARTHLDEILRMDPDHAFANRILGTLQYADGEYKLAEDSLRRSLKSRNDPEALNDLAWLLQESGLYEEAEKHARSSLAIDINNHHAWDTLGVILMRTDRYGPASKAFEHALSLSDNNLPVLIHTAELLTLQDKRAEAMAIIEALSMRSSELTSSDREQIDSLRRKLSKLR